jgi:hypothetical protein
MYRIRRSKRGAAARACVLGRMLVHAGGMQQRVLAYLSDANFLPVALQPHGESVWTGRIQSATVSPRQCLTKRDSAYRTVPCSTQLHVVRRESCPGIRMSYDVPAAIHTAQVQTIHSGTRGTRLGYIVMALKGMLPSAIHHMPRNAGSRDLCRWTTPSASTFHSI